MHCLNERRGLKACEELVCKKHPLNQRETGMTAPCHRIHSHSLIQTESVSQFPTAQWRQGQKEKRGETTRQTQKQKGRHRTDIPEDSEDTRSSPSPRQEVNLDKRVRVAVIVPGCQVPGLQHVDDQVSQVPVIVDLELKAWGGEKWGEESWNLCWKMQTNLELCVFSYLNFSCNGMRSLQQLRCLQKRQFMKTTGPRIIPTES